MTTRCNESVIVATPSYLPELITFKTSKQNIHLFPNVICNKAQKYNTSWLLTRTSGDLIEREDSTIFFFHLGVFFCELGYFLFPKVNFSFFDSIILANGIIYIDKVRSAVCIFNFSYFFFWCFPGLGCSKPD